MKKSIWLIPIILFAAAMLGLIFIAIGNIHQSIQLNPDDGVRNWPETSYININTASADELMVLPGVDEGLAANIIEYRQEHGPFGSIKEIQHVKGIGPVTYNSIYQFLTVGG